MLTAETPIQMLCFVINRNCSDRWGLNSISTTPPRGISISKDADEENVRLLFWHKGYLINVLLYGFYNYYFLSKIYFYYISYRSSWECGLPTLCYSILFWYVSYIIFWVVTYTHCLTQSKWWTEKKIRNSIGFATCDHD